MDQRPGGNPESGTAIAGIDAAAARSWAGYMRLLRAEIAGRKEDGSLSGQSAAPASHYAALVGVLDAIDGLPAAGTVELMLPPREELCHWVRYQQAVQRWADLLVADGLLTVEPSPDARGFWNRVEREFLATAG